MKQFFKALDAGFTAFCNELWLPTFGFHLFDDPADALEDECSCPTKECPLEAQDINDEAEAEENEWVHVAGIEGILCSHPFGYDHPCEKCGHAGGNMHVDVPVELAGSLSAPGDGPEPAYFPEAGSGHPNFDWADMHRASLATAAYGRDYTSAVDLWNRLSDKFAAAAEKLK